jgi:branched-chain amino acid transport system substrate-binding protein
MLNAIIVPRSVSQVAINGDVMKRYVVVTATLAAAASLALAGCSTGSSSGAADPSGGAGTIQIGVIESETGAFSSIGIPEVQGARAAAAQINAAGGILGKKVDLIVEDGQSTPQGAAAAATQLIQDDHVSAIVGPEATALALAVAPIAEASGVPMVSGSASFLAALPSKYLPYSFASAPSTAKAFVPLAAYWRSQGITKIGIFGPAGDVFDGIVAAVKATPGVQVVGTEQFQPGQADVTANLTKLLGSHPQSIVIAGAAADAATAQKAAKTLNTDVRIVNLASQANQAFIDLVGSANLTGNTIFSCAPTTAYNTLPAGNPAKTAATAYVEFMKAKYPGYDPGSLAVLAWNGLYAIDDAMTAAKSTDPAKVRDALVTTKMTNPYGIWQRNATDHDGSQNPFLVCKYDSSGWQYLAG